VIDASELQMEKSVVFWLLDFKNQIVNSAILEDDKLPTQKKQKQKIK